MAHHYTTDAVVLESRPQGEHHSALVLFTREFGLVYGVARSVRTSRSKLRGMLQKTFVGSVTLVRGKREWKIVGALEHHTLYYVLRHVPEQRRLAARVYWLLLRLVRGEERNERLYEVVDAFSKHLVSRIEAPHDLSALERLTVLRILSALGYGTIEDELKVLIDDDMITDTVLEHAKRHHALATKEINKALAATNL